MQHRQWSPAEAAEFAAARLAHTLRMLADDPKARLGMHRAAGIARTQGYGEKAYPLLSLQHKKRPSRRLGGRARRRAAAREGDRNTCPRPRMAVLSTSCPGTLAR